MTSSTSRRSNVGAR